MTGSGQAKDASGWAISAFFSFANSKIGEMTVLNVEYFI